VTSRVLLIDTSVAVALAVSDHEHHSATVSAIGRRPLGLSGHAAYETFSVLTRLPPPIRRTPGTVLHLLSRNFPESRFLGAQAARDLLDSLTQIGIAGGAVYDALVASAALEHQLPLATRDRRAIETYRALGVELEILV
jgi:predicted nucleic acid-binding protein